MKQFSWNRVQSSDFTQERKMYRSQLPQKTSMSTSRFAFPCRYSTWATSMRISISGANSQWNWQGMGGWSNVKYSTTNWRTLWPSWVRHWLRFPTMPFPCTRWLLKSQLWHLMLERRLEQWNQGSEIAALSAATLVKVTLDPLANYVIWINVNCFCIIAWAWNFEDALTWNDCGALSQIHQHELYQQWLSSTSIP